MLEEILNNELDFDSNRYFYHITSKGYGTTILENGLLLEEPDLKSTTIEITSDMMPQIGEYIEKEYVPNSLMKREEMVILGIPYEDVGYVIEKSNDKLPYVIRNGYILGYVDLETMEYYSNSEYEFGNQL